MIDNTWVLERKPETAPSDGAGVMEVCSTLFLHLLFPKSSLFMRKLQQKDCKVDVCFRGRL